MSEKSVRNVRECPVVSGKVSGMSDQGSGAAVRAMAISAEHERAIRSEYRAREVGRVPVQMASGFRVVALGK